MIAVKGNRVDAVKRILESGASPDACCDDYVC